VEREQFIEIVKQYQQMIYKVCCTYCENEENRKDLQQEVLMQLWKSMVRFDGRVKLSTWIYRVSLNTAISWYRKENKHTGNLSLDEWIFKLADESQDSQYEEKINLLYQFIEQQNELDRALLLLYLEDVRQKEIADILGISESNVATKISRLKKRIKTHFEHSNT